MRIALICPPWLAVPPKGYGGIEWVVALEADGLAEAGHDVTLFATGDSITKARLWKTPKCQGIETRSFVQKVNATKATTPMQSSATKP